MSSTRPHAEGKDPKSAYVVTPVLLVSLFLCGVCDCMLTVSVLCFGFVSDSNKTTVEVWV